jgi:nucleoside-diphosphate-sugar epimerase
MKVFLAGATGVIGRALVPKLVRGGHVVTGMTRSAQRAELLRAQGAEAVVCDALDAESLRAAVVAAQPEAVIHELTDIPAELDPRKYERQLATTNLLRRDGTRNLVAAARAAGARRLVAQSVAFAYAPVGDWIKDEHAPLALAAPPPMDKPVLAIADLEQQVLAADGIVLRYGFFYGPGTAFAPDGAYASMVRKRRLPVLGGGRGMWSLIHIEDAASATAAALERGASGIYNVVDDEPAPARDLIPGYAAALGAKPPLRLPAWIGRLLAGPVAVHGMTEQRAASNARAKRELGWTPAYPSWRDGLGRAS